MIEVIIKCSDDIRGSRNVYGEPLQEIVRCKDCDLKQVCKVSQHLGLDGYCSKGERKGE